MVRTNKKPFLSIIIISYNQEKYIKEAFLSALNQEYNSFEIIISDDCSTDNTWKIINEINTNVCHERIKVILNRNKTNLGIVCNFQKALSLTSGEWIVALAGDDIAKPNRLKVINYLSQIDHDIFAIGTGYDIINDKGQYQSKNKSCIRTELNLPMYPGFSAAIRRETYSEFPEIKDNIQSEDIIFSLRAFELGKILLSDISTIEYRIHSKNITSNGTSMKEYEGKINNHKNAIKTLKYYKKNEMRNKKLAPIIDKQIFKFESNIASYEKIITFYQMNFWKKIFNLSQIHSDKKYNDFKTFIFRLNLFIQSFKFLTSIVVNINRGFYLLKFLKEKLKVDNGTNQNYRLYHL
jgi:glycosyltransferase involved in cell wall biosynthesis